MAEKLLKEARSDGQRMAATTGRQRRTQSERSAETKKKLLQATVDVLLERGYAGLTTAQVDAKAGVSSGARVHHFPNKIDLVISATKWAYQRATELGKRRAEQAKKAPNPLARFVEDCRSIYFDWPFLIAVEIIIAARTDEQLMEQIQPVMEQYRVTMNSVWTDSLEAAGIPRKTAARELDLTLNMVRGMALNSMWRHDTEHYNKLLDDWLAERDLLRRESLPPYQTPK